MVYASTKQLAGSMGAIGIIPTREIGGDPSLENVGTGDSSEDTFYLNHNSILASSYIIYSGAAEASATALTETTDYVLTKDTGKIVLTAAGIIAVGTDIIFAGYSYVTIGLTDTYLAEIIGQAQAEVDGTLNATFTESSGVTNPDYPALQEVQSSQGSFNRNYQLDNGPLIDLTSLLDATITDSDITLDVTAGTGSSFPASGTILLGTEIITYTGVSTDTLTGLARGVNDSTAAAHTAGVVVGTTIVETSGTEEGSTPVWNVLTRESEFAIIADLGMIYIYNTEVLTGVLAVNALTGRPDVPERIRFNYLSGEDSIPNDITRLTIIYSKRMISADNITASLAKGRDEFRPEMFNIDNQEMTRIEGRRRQYAMGNT